MILTQRQTETAVAALGVNTSDAGSRNLKDVVEGLVDKGISGLGRILSGINKVMPSLLPTATAALATLSFRGTQGSFAAMAYPITLRADFFSTFGFSRFMIGSPLSRTLPIGDLTGFAQFRDAHITIQDNMTLSEANAIEEFLNAGVFLEWGGMP